MTTFPTKTAASLPDLSVVADDDTAWIKNHPSKTAQWRSSNGGYFSNRFMDDQLARGARVLREGNGRG